MNKGIEKILETKGIFVQQGKRSGKCAFLFPGHGAQYVGMFKELYENYSVVKEIFDEAEEKYVKLTKESLLKKIFSTESNAEQVLFRPTVMQPAIFLADIAMYELLKSQNIFPDYLLGHSLGELAALYAAGCYDLNQGLEIVYNRAAAVEMIPTDERGGMISIAAEYSESLKDELLSVSKGKCQVSIINSIHQFNISGPEDALQEIKAYCDKLQIKSTILKVSHAFHSDMLDDAVPVYRKALKEMEYNDINIPVYSTIIQKFYDTEIHDNEHFSDILCSQLVTPFDFRKIILDLIENFNVDCFIEVGPKDILSRIVEDIDLQDKCKIIPTNKKGQSEVQAINWFRAKYECCCLKPERNDGDMNINENNIKIEDELLNLISYVTMYPRHIIEKGNLDAPFIQEFAISENIGRDIINKIEKQYSINIPEEEYGVCTINSIISKIKGNEDKKEKDECVVDISSVNEFILEVIENITGYEKSMLEEDLDFEADLGIDSVKQGEIWDRVCKNFSININDIGNIKDINTIRQMADCIYSKSKRMIPAKIENVKEKKKINIRDRVLSLIEEKTGYPMEMLQDDLDLEADLGIDSVKQGEIFSQLKAEFELSETVNNIKDYNTIGAIIDYVEKKTDNTKQDEMVRYDETSASETDTIESEVLHIIEEKTGYPIEMLSADLDLEADLGIDSVKQSEIFSMLKEKYNFQIQDYEDLKELNTIEDIVKYTQKKILSLDLNKDEEQKLDDKYSTTRYVAVPVEQNISKDRIQDLSEKNVLIVADNLKGEITVSLYKNIIDKVKKVVVVGKEQLKDIPNMHIINFLDTLEIKNKISEINEKFKINIVINLMALSKPINLENVAKEQWEEMCSEVYNSNFYITKVLYSNFVEAKDECGYYTGTSIGGVYGLEKGYPGNPVGAISSGFTKALEKELRPFSCKVFDFSNLENGERIAKYILSEIQYKESLVETAYIGEQRKVIYVIPKEIKKNKEVSCELSDQDVILVTGGGRGIIYKCIETLLDYCNPHIIITGRTELDSIDRKIVEMSDEEFLAYKPAYLSKCRSENPDFSLLQLQHSYEKLGNARLLMQNMKKLYNKGYNIEYKKCDVASIEAVEDLVKYVINRYGKITGIINGAGLPSFGKVPKKEEKFAEQVVKVKANSFYTLYQTCKEQPIKFFVNMGSISGRFGMDGQVDYSAAADLIVRMSYAVAQKRKYTRFFVLGWSAWDEVGMAANEQVKKVQQDVRGLEYISVKEGTARFMDELLYGGQYPEVLFFGKLGKENLPLGQLEALNGGLDIIDKPCNKEGFVVDKTKYPLLDRIISVERDGIFATKKLMLNTDQHLKDHLVEGKHVFAGVMHVETACELFKFYLENSEMQNYKICGVENFKFEKFVKVFEGNELELKLEGGVVEEKNGYMKMHISIKSDFINKMGITIEKDRLHSEGDIIACKTALVDAKKKLPENNSKQIMNIDKYYKNSDKMITFGNSFRCIDNVVKIDENTIAGLLEVPEDGAYFSFVPHADTCISPVSIDNLGRLMLFHDFDRNGYSIVPVFIGKAKKYRDFYRGEKVQVFCVFESESDTSVFYSAYAMDKNETVIFEIKHMELKRINKYNGDHSLTD